MEPTVHGWKKKKPEKKTQYKTAYIKRKYQSEVQTNKNNIYVIKAAE